MRQHLRSNIFGRHSLSQRSDPQFTLYQDPRQNSITTLIQQGSSSTRQIVARTNCNVSSLPALRSGPQVPQKPNDGMNSLYNTDKIIEIIQRCSKVYPPVYCCNTYQFSSNSPAHFDKQIQDFQYLLSIVQQPNGIQKIGARNLYPFLHMLQMNLFHPICDVPNKIIYGDVVPLITEVNWPIIDLCYSIFIIVLRNLDSQILTSIISDKFLFSLLYMINSPDKREQNAVESLAYSVIEFNPKFQINVVNYISNHLLNYLNGTRSFLSIGTALKILRQLFKSKGFFHSLSFSQIAQNSIIPLFNTTFANEFYQQLSSLCSLFYESDEQIAAFSMQYLFSHWPITNSAKTTIFLNHIVIASSYLKMANRSIAETVFRFITEAIVSKNFKVTITALQICSDLHFYSYFLPFLKVLSPSLMSALQVSKNHWNEDVKKKTAEAFKIVNELITHSNKMEDYSPSFKKKPVCEDREKAWREIFAFAGKNTEDFSKHGFQPD